MNVILFFTYGISLEDWDNSGLISREIKLYKELSEKYKINFTFVTYGNSDDLKFVNLIDNLEIIPIYNIIKYSNNKFIRILKSFIIPFYLKREIGNNPQIIKTNQLYGAWVPILYKIITNSGLYIRTGYDLYTFSKYDNKNKIKQYFYLFLTFFALKVSDAYSVTSKVDFDFLKSKFSIKKNKLTLIPNWVDINENIRNIDERKNNIMTVGRLEKQKNYKFIIESIKDSEFELVIYGDGSEKKDLLKFSKNLSNIHLKGTIQNSELLEEYQNYKYFLSLSKYEGNSKAILEAMSSGCIVIASKIRNNIELIDQLENGVLFDMESDNLLKVIKKLDGDIDLQEKIFKNAIKKVKLRNSLNVIASKEYNIFEILNKC